MAGAMRSWRVNSIDDLVARVVSSISGPVDLLAPSMGGVIAVRAAPQRPGLVNALIPHSENSDDAEQENGRSVLRWLQKN
jgi:alpha-beta hydrolase superfamily lysophospholipase